MSAVLDYPEQGEQEKPAPKLSKAAEEAILKEARERFALCLDREADNRRDALDDLKFLNGDQWPEDVKRQRKSRPCLMNNRLPQFVNQVVNEQRKSRPAITVSPVGNGANVKTATVLQGLIRHIERISRAEVAYDNAFKYAVSCSFGHFKVITDYAGDDSFDQELRVKLINNPFTVYTGEHNEPDGIDARYRFITEKVKIDDFEAKYGFKPTSLQEAAKGDDNENWFDTDEVRVAEYWRIVDEEFAAHQLSDGTTYEGELTLADQKDLLLATGISVQQSRQGVRCKVEQYLMTGDRIIKQADWAGKYIPIVTVTGGEINIEGKKTLLSLFRFAKDAQRLDNFWASAEAEMLALQPKAPWQGAEGSFDGHESEYARANTDNVPYLEYKVVPGQPPPQRQMFVGSPTGIREARMAAIEDQKAIMGIYDASLGARSNEVSGVAIRARQDQGDTATYHFIDAMAKAIESCGRILIDLIPKVYDTARMVRIVKPDDQAELVAINQIFIDPTTGLPNKYDLALGTYDVAVKVGPSFQTQREEARAAMLELMQQYPQSAPAVGDLFAANLDFPDADQIAQRLKNLVPPQAMGQSGPPDPMQAVEQAKAQQIQMKGQIDLQGKQMDLQMKQLEAQLQAQSAQEKAQDRQMEMELKRMELQIRQQDLQLQAILHQRELAGQNAQAGMPTGADQSRIMVAQINAAVERMKVELQEETKRMIAASQVDLQLARNMPQPLVPMGAPNA